MTHTNFTQPVVLLTGNGGEFGIALYEGGHQLIGWVNGIACRGSSTVLTKASRHNQWFHVALSWLSDEVYLFFNGNLLSTCANSPVYLNNGRQVYINTHSNNSFMLIIPPPHSKPGYRIAVSIVNVWERIIESEMGISDFMGLLRTDEAHFAKASHYWPMNGLLTDLAPGRFLTSNVVRVKDSRNVDGAAMCTTNSKQSHLVLTGDVRPSGKNTNLFYSCLYDTSQCTTIIFMLDFRLNGDPEYVDHDYVLLTSPLERSNVGITITLNPAKQLLKVEHRNKLLSCHSWANLSVVTNARGGWTNLQAFIADKCVTLRLNDIQSLNPTTCTDGPFSSLDNNSSPFPKIVIGEELGVCVSNVAIVENSKQSDPDPLPVVEVCYPGADAIFPLEGLIPNRFGNPNKATDLSTFTERITSKKMSSCLNNLMVSCSEISLSFWLFVKRMDSSIVDTVI